MIPDALIRVQVRSIWRKGFQIQAGRSGEKLLNRVAPMNIPIVQQNDQRAGYLTQQMAKKYSYFIALNVIFVELAVQ